MRGTWTVFECLNNEGLGHKSNQTVINSFNLSPNTILLPQPRISAILFILSWLAKFRGYRTLLLGHSIVSGKSLIAGGEAEARPFLEISLPPRPHALFSTNFPYHPLITI